jgi:hypothetical protein
MSFILAAWDETDVIAKMARETPRTIQLLLSFFNLLSL